MSKKYTSISFLFTPLLLFCAENGSFLRDVTFEEPTTEQLKRLFAADYAAAQKSGDQETVMHMKELPHANQLVTYSDPTTEQAAREKRFMTTTGIALSKNTLTSPARKALRDMRNTDKAALKKYRLPKDPLVSAQLHHREPLMPSYYTLMRRINVAEILHEQAQELQEKINRLSSAAQENKAPADQPMQDYFKQEKAKKDKEIDNLLNSILVNLEMSKNLLTTQEMKSAKSYFDEVKNKIETA